ncbi:ubiquitin-like small modifier protein 1 [Methanothrix harundinacea]|uniref:Molybdopterin synthase subunit MoaD n=1 Tax=Methanothrix harundinacea (strain 6Ac) TaxID=1110509 RepID=G7WND4_METH6|nr:ubiquitin-like small modifier protein 1 [Methanothrix harundinacea]AET64625.1 Molybdopterin synthase subunit MoaD [Methanothrix harundinacea 6Ac]
MLIRIKAFARYRALLGSESEVKLAEGAAVSDLLESLASRSGELRGQLFDDSGRVREDLNVMVNGRHFLSLAGEETPLAEGDEVALFPAVVGG